MKTYTIAIEETLCEGFDIEAENEQEAIQKAISMYRNEEIALCPGELQHKQLAVISPNRQKVKWIPF